MTYDLSGNALTATITPKSGTDKIVTTNTYTNSNNQLSTVKQRGQYTTTYNYADNANKMYGLASSVVDPQGAHRSHKLRRRGPAHFLQRLQVRQHPGLRILSVYQRHAEDPGQDHRKHNPKLQLYL